MSATHPKINNKVVVITGASMGIGKATALKFAKAGARVVLASRQADLITALSKEITGNGGTALAVPTDVTRSDQVRALVSKTLERLGQIDIWINNAGYG